MKVLQPRGVARYYSETLQDLYGQYLLGAFDPYLERSDDKSLSPVRFEEWYRTFYRAMVSQDRMRRELEMHLVELDVRQEAEARRSQVDEVSRLQTTALQHAVGEALNATSLDVKRHHG